MSDFETIKQNVEYIREQMDKAWSEAGRPVGSTLLCSACKTRTVEEVRDSARVDIDLFGENHVQELVEKYDADAYLGKPGHLIGHLQTNKIKYVIGRASLIQSIDSDRVLDAIEKEAAKKGIIQDGLIELNIGMEASKTGLNPDELYRMLEHASKLPHVRIKGLMTIPPFGMSRSENRKNLAAVRELFEKSKSLHLDNVSMEILSMGMSDDYYDAILEGSTMVRIGSAIYGPRIYGAKA